MTTIEMTTTTIELPGDELVIDDAQLVAVAFLARYSGRTLDAYRHDLRSFLQWADDNQLTVLAATRPHIELYRGWMEDRGLAASTIDRADRRCTRRMPAAWTVPSSACSCSPPSSTTVTTRRLRCCSA